MTQFIRGANPIWFMVDNVGQPLNDQYYAFFLTNTLPYLFQNVYQDPNGNTQWSNPLQFQPNGTLPNNLYFDETLTYRIEIRQGPTQSDPLIGNPIQNYVPGSTGGNVIANPLTLADNMVTNPQFADVYFTPTGYTYTQSVGGTYIVPIGPGWNLELIGAGTTRLRQVTIDGASNIAGNPTYYLEITNSGWGSATLIQTFENNGAIFANGAVAAYMLAFATGLTQLVTVSYVTNGTSEAIWAKPVATGSFQAYFDAINLGLSSNPDEGTAASVNIEINLPATGEVSLTNIQVVGQSVPLANFNALTDTPAYQEQTYERTVDHEFHVYKNSLLIQPKDSLLTGWNFSLNPFQFSAPGVYASKTQYIADQTIIHQETAGAFTGGKSSVQANSNLFIRAVNGVPANRVALIQYINPATILPYWSYVLSMLANVQIQTGNSTTVGLKARLIYRTTLPSAISNTEPIASWPANSDPVFAAGWTEIAPINDPVYTLTNGGVPPYTDMPFNGFQMPLCTTSTMTLGVVIYTTNAINDGLGVEDILVFDKISLVPNEFAIQANPLTFDQTLRQCQYYYEKSYNSGVLPGTVTKSTQGMALQATIFDGVNHSSYPASFSAQYAVEKRATPIITIYAPSAGNTGHVDAFLYVNGAFVSTANAVLATFWTIDFNGLKGFQYTGTSGSNLLTTVAAIAGDYSYITYHFTADARLGI